jgi:hypothetical protein
MKSWIHVVAIVTTLGAVAGAAPRSTPVVTGQRAAQEQTSTCNPCEFSCLQAYHTCVRHVARPNSQEEIRSFQFAMHQCDRTTDVCMANCRRAVRH